MIHEFEEEKIDKIDDIWDTLAEINGLDCELGLSRVSGLKEAYIDSLKVLVQEIPLWREQLSRYINEKDLRGFGITAHGIKGVLANIGVMQLSELALGLEEAAKRNDFDFCSGYLGAVNSGLKELEVAIGKVFADARPKDAEELTEESAQILTRLKTALLEMDFIGVDNLLEDLEKFSNIEGFDKLQYHILIMEYEEAAGVIDTILS